MGKINKILDGRKTWIGVAFAVITFLGWDKYITPDQANLVLDNLSSILATGFLVVGLIHKDIKAKRS